MSNVTSFSLPKLEIEAATNPKVYNLSVPLANTEYSQALSDGTKKIAIKVRGVSKSQVAFVSGDSGLLFVTIPAGCSLNISEISLSGSSIYIQCSKAGQTVEILEWS